MDLETLTVYFTKVFNASLSTDLLFLPVYSTSLALVSLVLTYAPYLLVWPLLVTLGRRLWSWYCEHNRDKESRLPLPPGTMGLPLIGETIQFILKKKAFDAHRLSTYGNVFKTHILGRPTVRVIGSQNVRKVLMSEHKLVTSQWPASARRLLGMGTLSMSTGAIHRTRRRAVARAFTHEALRNYVLPIRHVVTKNLQRWCDVGSVMAYTECKRLAANVATEVLLGLDFNEKDTMTMIDSLTDLSDNIFSIPLDLPGFGFRKGLRARKVLQAAIEEKITAKAVNQTGASFRDALSIIIEDMETENEAPEVATEEIKDLALEFMFAGLETTASAMCSLVFYLAKKPEVLEKLYQELLDLEVINREDDSVNLDYERLNKMTYANYVYKEVLRLNPPIGGGFRRALQTFEVAGYQIPKGWSVLYSIRDTQRQSETFDDIDDFRPERWETADENVLSGKWEYIPFGGGSRACAGKEVARILLKIFILELARSCSWSLVNENPDMKLFPVPHPKDNLPIIVRETAAFRRRAHTV